MGLPNVTLQYLNGGLGLVAPSADRVVGLIVNGTGNGHPPFVVFSYRDFQTQFATLGEDVNDPVNIEIAAQVSDFYKAGGAELWVRIVNVPVTTAVIFSGTVASDFVKASDGRINVIGVHRLLAGGATPTLTNGLNADIVSAMDEAQAFAEAMAAQFRPVRVVLDACDYSGVSTDLPNLKANTYNRVMMCIAAVRANGHAAIGMLLGRISASPVNQNIGRVKSGSVPTSSAYLTNNVAIETLSYLDLLNDKGFVFLRKYPNKAGYYWNDDHMVCADTDDYYSLSNGRTMDKVARIVYATFADELLDTVFVDDKGKILKTTLKQYQSRIERAIGLSMVAEGEISNVAAFIDPNLDIIATSKLVVDVRVTPTGTNRVILVRIGLYNPNAA